MASGGGTTFEAIMDAVVTGEISADHIVLSCNKLDAGVIERAKKFDVPTVAVDGKAIGPEAMDDVIAQTVEQHEIGLIMKAGYLPRLGPKARASVKGKALNTHPALLEDDPAERKYGGKGMFGEHVHHAVFENHEVISGATVHMADGEFDHGPVLRRAEADIANARDEDEVGSRVQAVEKPLVVSVLRDVLNGDLILPQVT